MKISVVNLTISVALSAAMAAYCIKHEKAHAEIGGRVADLEDMFDELASTFDELAAPEGEFAKKCRDLSERKELDALKEEVALLKEKIDAISSDKNPLEKLSDEDELEKIIGKHDSLGEV